MQQHAQQKQNNVTHIEIARPDCRAMLT